jgi:probable HAF family extracellular repeat protein
MIKLLKRLSTCITLCIALVCITAGGASAAPPPGWTVIDLTTLGGTVSYPAAINDSGRVVGDSQTAAGDTHGFYWTQATGMVNLPPLGGTFSTAVAVNASGQAAGISSTAAGAQHAVRWSATGVPTDITPTAIDSSAIAINASGAVAGTMTVGVNLRAFYWSGSGTAVQIPTLTGGTYNFATGMNASGQVIGYSGFTGNREHAFSWTPAGGVVDLGAVANTDSQANAVNDNGQVVGYYAPNADAKQGFSWTAGTRTLIGAASPFTTALAVSPTGQVVGANPAAADSTMQQAFSWTAAGGLVQIPTLGGSIAFASSVNAAGEVVGNSTITDDMAGRAFFWTAAGGTIDLGTIAGNDSFATAISGNGQVVGTTTVGDETHAVLWMRGDATPPVVTPTVAGTAGLNGWYTSDVTVTWAISDPQTPAQPATCPPTVVSADTSGVPVTCASTSAGGTTTQSVTVRRDATAPVVAFAAHPAGYVADQKIVIPCTASDATSGIATTCQGINLAASSLPLGNNTRTTTATDMAGNTTTASTTFTIVAVGQTPPSAIVQPDGTITPATPRSRVIVATALSPKLKAFGNAVRVTLRAPAGAIASGSIQLKAKLSAAGKAKLKGVGSKAFALTAGQTKTFTVALTKSGKARLARIGKLKITVVIAARDAAGKPKATTRTITLKVVKK